MKKVLFSAFLCSVWIQGNAQLQSFTDPDFGRFDPKFLHQGYLIGNNYTQNSQTGNYDVFNGIHKVNLTNGETTQFSFGQQGGFEMPSGINTKNTHQDDIYVGVGGFYRKISLNENHVYDQLMAGGLVIPIENPIFIDRIYFNDNWYGTRYYDISIGEIITLGYNNNNSLDGAFFSEIRVADNVIFAIRNLSLSQGQQGSKLLKVNSNYEIVDDAMESSLNSEGEGNYISTLHSLISGQINRRTIVNGRELFLAQMHSGTYRLLSVDPNNFQSTNFISGDLSVSTILASNYITLSDGIIFSIDDNYYKTNGVTTLEQIDLDIQGIFDTGGFQSPSPYNLFIGSGKGSSFVHVGGNTYFNTMDNYVEKIYKMTSIDDTPELIFTTTVEGNVYQIINYAVEWNGNLVFVVHSNDSTVADKIYLYNGTELILNPDLNTFLDAEPRQMTTENENQSTNITGLLPYGDLLLVNTNQGVYAIEYDEVLSVQDNISLYKLQISPNPVKDILNLSDKIKEISVYDLSGKLVKEEKEVTDNIDISALPKGNYIIKGITETGEKFANKVIKN